MERYTQVDAVCAFHTITRACEVCVALGVHVGAAQRGVQDNDGIEWGSGGAARNRADAFVRAQRREYVLQHVDGMATRRILDGSTLRGAENSRGKH